MEGNVTDVITDEFLQQTIIPRKQLLPKWIKVFAWIFLVVGVALPILFIISMITHSFNSSLYWLEADTIFSATGILIAMLFIFKAIVAAGLLKQKDWAVKTGIIDALIGILICVAVMVYGA